MSETTPTSKKDKLEFNKIRTDGGTQVREGINADVVDEYAEAIAGGAVFPAVIAFHDGTHYGLADGFHRVAAALKAGLTITASRSRPGPASRGRGGLGPGTLDGILEVNGCPGRRLYLDVLQGTRSDAGTQLLADGV